MVRDQLHSEFDCRLNDLTREHGAAIEELMQQNLELAEKVAADSAKLAEGIPKQIGSSLQPLRGMVERISAQCDAASNKHKKSLRDTCGFINSAISGLRTGIDRRLKKLARYEVQ